MDWTLLLQTVLPYLPAKYAGDAVSVMTFLIAACALALRFWKPPSASSPWARIYALVTAIAQSKGWNTPAYKPDAKALMIPLTADRDAEALKLGLDPLSTHPKSSAPPKSG